MTISPLLDPSKRLFFQDWCKAPSDIKSSFWRVFNLLPFTACVSFRLDCASIDFGSIHQNNFYHTVVTFLFFSFHSDPRIMWKIYLQEPRYCWWPVVEYILFIYEFILSVLCLLSSHMHIQVIFKQSIQLNMIWNESSYLDD